MIISLYFFTIKVLLKKTAVDKIICKVGSQRLEDYLGRIYIRFEGRTFRVT